MKSTKTLYAYHHTISILKGLISSPEITVSIDHKKHKLLVEKKSGISRQEKYSLRLPLPYPSLKPFENLEQYLAKLEESVPPYTILLIQAGNSALGYFEEGEVIYHKIIRKYMVRKKQGKAQITYLNKKGKSRAGSRIRLAETIEFFEEINQKLREWEPLGDSRRILYSCPPRLWGLLFDASVLPPFDKKDRRLIKIPMDVHVPNFEELLKVNRFVLKSEKVDVA